MNSLFGPLSKNYCIYFYGMSILFFIFFVMSVVHIASHIFRRSSKLDSKFYANSVAVVFYTLLVYLLNRLMYTMCMNSTY
jgi:hypothetical protein